MEDVPQPSDDPYEEGDEVQIYLGKDDPDGHLHGTRAIVVNRIRDSLGEETGRELDSYIYQLRDADTSDELPDYRHRDLVPTHE